MIKNIETKVKCENAVKMMRKYTKYLDQGRYFTPTWYEKARARYKLPTPSFGTLVKYADEIGLKCEMVQYAWHNDGSIMANACGIEEGTVYTHKMYRFW